MNILGLQCGYNGSACVVKDGEIVAFSKTGDNLERGITKQLIKNVLDDAGLKLKDINLAAIVNWFGDREADGTECWDKNEEKFSITKENGIEYSFDDFASFYRNNSMVAQGTYSLNIDNQVVSCMIVDHLFAHCAYSYLTSPFTQCMSICLDTMDGHGANNAIYWMQDEDKAFRCWRRDQTFAAINVYTGFTDVLGMYPALYNFNALKELANQHKGDAIDVSDWVWPQNVQMGNIFHGDQGTALMALNGITNVPEKFGYYPPLEGEGEIDDAWMNKNDDKTLAKRASIAANVLSVVEGSLRNYVEKVKVLGGNITIGGKVTMFDNIVTELQDEKTVFTSSHNDEELSAGAALFVSDQLMKTKKGEIITNTKNKVQSKGV